MLPGELVVGKPFIHSFIQTLAGHILVEAAGGSSSKETGKILALMEPHRDFGSGAGLISNLSFHSTLCLPHFF